MSYRYRFCQPNRIFCHMKVWDWLNPAKFYQLWPNWCFRGQGHCFCQFPTFPFWSAREAVLSSSTLFMSYVAAEEPWPFVSPYLFLSPSFSILTFQYCYYRQWVSWQTWVAWPHPSTKPVLRWQLCQVYQLTNWICFPLLQEEKLLWDINTVNHIFYCINCDQVWTGSWNPGSSHIALPSWWVVILWEYPQYVSQVEDSWATSRFSGPWPRCDRTTPLRWSTL